MAQHELSNSFTVTITIGHRGDPRGHVENTLQAFRGALSLGAQMVELDCRLTSDGEVAVLHDANMKRLWGIDKPVRHMSWAEVAAATAGSYRVPKLTEVLSELDCPTMVDLTETAVAEPALKAVVGAGALGRCVFAGHTEALLRVRQVSADARIALSWRGRQLPGPALLKELSPAWFNPSYRLVSARLVRSMHERGLTVSTWTVDRRWEMARALSAGVDAIISNRVALMVAAVARKHGPVAK